MRRLNPESDRPELVVDQRTRPLVEKIDRTQVGFAGPVGRERCLYALPLNNGVALPVRSWTLLHDHDNANVADPADVIVAPANGEAVWIPRLLTARWTEDTRRLAGG